MDNMKIATSSDRKITISTLVSWIVSIFLIIVAMGAFPKSVPGASLILLSGIILLPSVITLITNKFNVSSFGRLRMIAAIVLFLAGMSLVPSTVKNSNVSTLEQKLAAEVTTVENTQVASNVDTTQAKEVVQNNFIFDVPSLLHKNIDEVISVLGVPKDNSELTSEQMKLGDDKWSKEFEKNGYTLTVTYHVKDRSVVDFFVGANDNVYENRDKTEMFKITNTNDSSSQYSTSFVEAMKDSSRFTGILIKAK